MRRTRLHYAYNVYRRPPLYRTLATIFAYMIGGLCLYAFMMFMFVNWVSHCGERVWTSATSYHMGECVSMATIFGEWLW